MTDKMTLNPLVGGDATIGPLQQNFRIWGQELRRTFYDQPNLIRMNAPWVNPCAFDGRNEIEETTWQDLELPEYGMKPGLSHTQLLGDSVVTKIPQIYKSARDSIDDWRRNFGPPGNQRMPILMQRLRELVKIKEDLIGFLGDTGEAVTGLRDAGTAIASAGSWATDADADGIKENMKADFLAHVQYFTDLGLGQYPVDFFITFGAYNYMIDIDTPARSDSMWSLITSKPYIGNIMASNNVWPDSVSSGTHTLISMPRVPAALAGWGLVSSEVVDIAYPDYPWAMVYALREKYNIQIIKPELIAVTNDIVLV